MTSPVQAAHARILGACCVNTHGDEAAGAAVVEGGLGAVRRAACWICGGWREHTFRFAPLREANALAASDPRRALLLRVVAAAEAAARASAAKPSNNNNANNNANAAAAGEPAGDGGDGGKGGGGEGGGGGGDGSSFLVTGAPFVCLHLDIDAPAFAPMPMTPRATKRDAPPPRPASQAAPRRRSQ